jgi:hypothetical protein
MQSHAHYHAKVFLCIPCILNLAVLLSVQVFRCCEGERCYARVNERCESKDILMVGNAGKGIMAVMSTPRSGEQKRGEWQSQKSQNARSLAG